MVLKIAITLVITPLLVRNLGNYDYGIWEITVAIFGYLGFLDIGIPSAIEVYAAKFVAANDSKRLGSLYRTSLILFSVIGVFAGLSWGLWSLYWIPTIDADDSNKYWVFASLILAQNLVQFPGLAAQSMLQGFQKYSKTNAIKALTTIISSALIIALMTEENALLLLALVTVVAQISKFTSYFLILRGMGFRVAGEFAGKFDKSVRKSLFKFGSKSFFQGAALGSRRNARRPS